MCRFPIALLMICAVTGVAVAGELEVFRVMPPGERVLQSGITGISAVMIVEGGSGDQGGRLHSDLRGRIRLELGGVILEARDGRGFSVDSGSGEESALDATVTRRLLLHDFPALALETRPVFDELTQFDEAGTRWEGRGAGGESGILYRDDRGRISGYDVQFNSGEAFEVRFLEWVRMGDLELPSRVRTSDAGGDHQYRISGYREEAMPESGVAEPARWKDEGELPQDARDALAAERAFALGSKTDGMKAAFLEWVVPQGTVFGPGPISVEDRFAAVPDEASKQPALGWLPEWIVISGSRELAMISGRWDLTPVGGESPTDFGQYLSVWQRGPEGWRVLADIGSNQEEPRALTPKAIGRMIEARSPRIAMVPDPGTLAAQVEGEFEALAFRDGYAQSLVESADSDVIALRVGEIARRGVDALTVDDRVAELGPRIEVLGSAAAAAHDMLATWGVMHFEAVEGGPVRLAFLRVWQLETVRWQIIADATRLLP
jgi:hypothetical protein